MKATLYITEYTRLAGETAQCGLALDEAEIQLAELVSKNFPDYAWAAPILAKIRLARRAQGAA